MRMKIILAVIIFNVIIALNKICNGVEADTTAKYMVGFIVIPTIIIAVIKDFRKGDF